MKRQRLGGNVSPENDKSTWGSRDNTMILCDEEKVEYARLKKDFSNAGQSPLSRRDVISCIRTALRRLSVLIAPEGSFPDSREDLLKRADYELNDRFRDEAWDNERFYIDYSCPDEGRTLADVANNKFYCEISLERTESNVERIDLDLTRMFWVNLHLGQRMPDRDLGADSESSVSLLKRSLVAYILRNFLHNFAHIRQGVDHLNYHRFAGKTREYSDFYADNVSNLGLIMAYGYNPITSGEINTETKEKFNKIFRLARFNDIFKLRAKYRKEADDPEWRLSRSISSAISQKIISSGRVVSDLSFDLKNFNAELCPDKSEQIFDFTEVLANFNGKLFSETFSEISKKERRAIINEVSERIGGNLLANLNEKGTRSSIFESVFETQLKFLELSLL